MLFIGLMFLATFYTPIMVIIIPLILIISLIMRKFGSFEDDLSYSPRAFAGFAIITIVLGSMVEFLVIIPLGLFAIYTFFCVLEDVSITNIFLLPIRYLWADIHGILFLVVVILALLVTAIQIALMLFACITIIPLIFVGLPQLNTLAIVKLLTYTYKNDW